MWSEVVEVKSRAEQAHTHWMCERCHLICRRAGNDEHTLQPNSEATDGLMTPKVHVEFIGSHVKPHEGSKLWEICGYLKHAPTGGGGAEWNGGGGTLMRSAVQKGCNVNKSTLNDVLKWLR